MRYAGRFLTQHDRDIVTYYRSRRYVKLVIYPLLKQAQYFSLNCRIHDQRFSFRFFPLLFFSPFIPNSRDMYGVLRTDGRT